MNRGVISYGIAVCSVSLIYVLTQLYVYIFPAYDVGTLAVGAMVPLFASILIAYVLQSRVLLYALLAYFWALVEDAPVYLDSVFTWPEVTRFHPATPHLFLEVLYHSLTALFLLLAVKEARRGAKMSLGRKALAGSLLAGGFVLAYAQNIPVAPIQDIVESQWYQLDLLEHLASGTLTIVGLLLASGRGVRSPNSQYPHGVSLSVTDLQRYILDA